MFSQNIKTYARFKIKILILTLPYLTGCSDGRHNFGETAQSQPNRELPDIEAVFQDLPGKISFASTPKSITQNKIAIFEIEADRKVETFYYSLDGAEYSESTDNKVQYDVYTGTHSLRVKADFVDGTISEEISYDWKYDGVMEFVAKGSAFYDANAYGGAWTITPSQINQVGLLITKFRYQLTKFRVTFNFQIDQGAGACTYGSGYGDGMAFGFTSREMADINPSAGGNIGFIGTGGVGFKLDTFQNPGEPSDNFIAFLQDLGPAGVMTLGTPITTDLPRFRNNGEHQVEVEFDTGKLSVKIDSVVVVNDVDIPGWTDGQSGHLFFSASTGGACNRHLIRSISIPFLNAYGSEITPIFLD